MRRDVVRRQSQHQHKRAHIHYARYAKFLDDALLELSKFDKFVFEGMVSMLTVLSTRFSPSRAWRSFLDPTLTRPTRLC